MQFVDNDIHPSSEMNNELIINSSNLEIDNAKNNDFVNTSLYNKLLRSIFFDTFNIKRMEAIKELRNNCNRRRFLRILIVAEKTEKSRSNKLQIRMIINHLRRHKKKHDLQ